jgi:cytochrome c oxidase assembly factor CtaG
MGQGTVSAWIFSSIPAVFFLALLLLYLRGWRIVSRQTSSRVPPWRLEAFLAGAAAAWFGWAPPLERLTRVLLTAHMVQHLLLVLVASPLLLLGSPLLVIREGWAGSREGDRALPSERAVPSRAMRAVGWLTHPIPAALLMIAVTIGWHIPYVFEAAMLSRIGQFAENTTFLASGILFWWPVILPWPSTHRWPRWIIPLYLLGADLPISVLAAYLAFCGRVVYSTYLAAPRMFGISALNDQVAAAMLMWVSMMVVFAAVAGAEIYRWLQPRWPQSAEVPTPREVSVHRETTRAKRATFIRPAPKHR